LVNLGPENLGRVPCFSVLSRFVIHCHLLFNHGDCFDFDADAAYRPEEWLPIHDGEDWCSRSIVSIELEGRCVEDDDASGEHGQKRRSRRGSQALTTPKVLKNDIRRCFAKMFINTINAGEFENMQQFVHTFMLPDCPFGLKVVMADNFGLPAVLHSVGPRMHVHYLLGGFVMFPDMVLTMGDSQIVTSNVWTGTKIVIPIDCRMTKTHHIPAECWIPPSDKVEKMYTESSIDRMMAALTMEDGGGNVNRVVTPTARSTEVKKKRKRRTATAVISPPVMTQLVPQSYADCLHEGAVIVDSPQRSHLRGVYTIMLDGNNRMQSIALVVMPVDE